MSDWISTKKAMEILGVGSTTIKRWADDGLLPFKRTAGGHRRFSHAELLRYSESEEVYSSEEVKADEPATIQQWLNWLLHLDTDHVNRKIRGLHAIYGNWFEVCDFLGRVLEAVGRNWEDNEWSVLEEHIATIKLSHAIDAVAISIPVKQPGKSCLIATLAGEHHAHGLHMAQLCMRSVGIKVIDLGTNVDSVMLAALIAKSDYQMLALSASACQKNAKSMEPVLDEIADICRELNITMYLGGEGAWPEGSRYGYRCHSFVEFGKLLDQHGFIAE